MQNDDIDLGGTPPPFAQDDPLAGVEPSAEGLGEATRPGSADIAPAAPGVAEGSLGGVGDALGDEPTDPGPEAQEAPEPAEEVVGLTGPDDGSVGEALSGIPPQPDDVADDGSPIEPEPEPEAAQNAGGSPTREYMIFEELDLGDLVDLSIGVVVDGGEEGDAYNEARQRIIEELKRSGGKVYRQRTFDIGDGRPVDRIDSRNAPNALRAAARLLPAGYSGTLVPVTDSAWRPRVVTVKPREGTQVELG